MPEPFEYYDRDGVVYTRELALEISAIWDGIDRLEQRGVSLETIARRLNEDWETSVIALAMFGRRP